MTNHKIRTVQCNVTKPETMTVNYNAIVIYSYFLRQARTIQKMWVRKQRLWEVNGETPRAAHPKLKHNFRSDFTHTHGFTSLPVVTRCSKKTNPGLCLCVHNTPKHTLSKYILQIQAEEEDGFPLIPLCTGDLWPWWTSRSVCRCLWKLCVKIHDRDNNPLHWCMDSWLVAAF